MRWGVLVVALAGGCVVQTPLAIPGFSTNPYAARERYERKAAQDLTPVDLVVPDGNPPTVHVFKLRVWVDADFRAKPRWRADVEEVIARASSYTEAAFGARLEADIRTWDRGGDATMTDIVRALEALDPGAGVDWVIGFVSAAHGITSDYHVIGYAEALGKHFALRDMNDADEARDVEKYLDELSASERTELYTRRRRHKELSSFLHEWAHTLGHPHETEAGRLLAPSYSNKAATFSDAGARLLRASVVARAGGPGSADALGQVKRILESSPPGWDEAQRGQLLGMLAGVPSGGGVPVGGFPTGGRVVAPIGDDGVAAVHDAFVRNDRGDRTGAVAALDAVRLDVVPGGPSWENAARLYLALGALGRCDELLARLPKDPRSVEIGADVLRLRRQVGLPPDAALSGAKPEDESELTTSFIEAAEKMGTDDKDTVKRVQARLQKKFPRALPTLVLRCAAAGANREVAEARRACAAALARWGDLTYAQFWAGQVASSTKERIAHHRRVIELDPAQKSSWQVLAELYRQTKDKAALATLSSDYQVRFGASLPGPSP